MAAALTTALPCCPLNQSTYIKSMLVDNSSSETLHAIIQQHEGLTETTEPLGNVSNISRTDRSLCRFLQQRLSVQFKATEETPRRHSVSTRFHSVAVKCWRCWIDPNPFFCPFYPPLDL